MAAGPSPLKTVHRPPDAKGFIVLPRRWAERWPTTSETLINWAAITLMTRRLTRKPIQQRPHDRDVATYEALHSAGILGTAGGFWVRTPRRGHRTPMSSVAQNARPEGDLAAIGDEPVTSVDCDA